MTAGEARDQKGAQTDRDKSSAASVRQPPVRLCCMRRHDGPVCPDGKVMCCLCFGRFAVEELNVSDGTPEDVCVACAENERRAAANGW